MPRPQPSIRDQLLRLLKETDTPQRTLGRLLARLELPESDPDFKVKWDARTRWVGKVLSTGKDRVTNPTRESLTAIETALRQPGYFKVPPPVPRAAKAEREDRVDGRLAALERKARTLHTRVKALEEFRAVMLSSEDELATALRAEAAARLSRASLDQPSPPQPRKDAGGSQG